MYLPRHFDEQRIDVLHDAIREIAFGTLVTTGSDGLIASHIPLLLDPEPAPYGTLIGHVARGNPQWSRFDRDTPALAMFTGPHAYVSPSWYPSKQETGRDVPTWNYIAVHAYGTLDVFDDAERLLSMLHRLTDRHEHGRPTPWRVDDAPADYIAQQLRGIVGFALPIARIEGKWKLSQNRAPADRAGAQAGLAQSTNERERDVAAAMLTTMPT